MWLWEDSALGPLDDQIVELKEILCIYEVSVFPPFENYVKAKGGFHLWYIFVV